MRAVLREIVLSVILAELAALSLFLLMFAVWAALGSGA